MPGLIDLAERMSAIGTMDAKWKLIIGIVFMIAWCHGEGRSKTALHLVLLDSPLKVRRDIYESS